MKRAHTLSKSRARAGFTILEVLLALGILLFGMAAILGLLTLGAALTKSAEQRTQAASAAEAVIADLQESFFPLVPGPDGTLEPGEPLPVKEKLLPGSDGVVYSASAVQNPQRADEYRVDVTLSWSSSGVRRERRITTLLVRELPFGERLRRQFIDPNRTSPAVSAPAPNSAAAPAAAPPR